MGISKKKRGPTPNEGSSLERWQKLAMRTGNDAQARAAYREIHRNATLPEAHRAVQAFILKHKVTW